MVSTLATKKTASESIQNPESLNFLKVRELVKISIGNLPEYWNFFGIEKSRFQKILISRRVFGVGRKDGDCEM